MASPGFGGFQGQDTGQGRPRPDRWGQGRRFQFANPTATAGAAPAAAAAPVRQPAPAQGALSMAGAAPAAAPVRQPLPPASAGGGTVDMSKTGQPAAGKPQQFLGPPTGGVRADATGNTGVFPGALSTAGAVGAPLRQPLPPAPVASGAAGGFAPQADQAAAMAGRPALGGPPAASPAFQSDAFNTVLNSRAPAGMTSQQYWEQLNRQQPAAGAFSAGPATGSQNPLQKFFGGAPTQGLF